MRTQQQSEQEIFTLLSVFALNHRKMWAMVRISQVQLLITVHHHYMLYYLVMLSHFLHSLGNRTSRAIFPEMCNINQSSAVFSVDCLIDGKSILTWLVYWIRTAWSVFTGAELKPLNITGQYSIALNFEPILLRIMYRHQKSKYRQCNFNHFFRTLP